MNSVFLFIKYGAEKTHWATLEPIQSLCPRTKYRASEASAEAPPAPSVFYSAGVFNKQHN